DVEVLVGAAPGVVHTHRVVGRDRSVEEGPAPGRIVVAAQVRVDDAVAVPVRQPIALHRREVGARLYLPEALLRPRLCHDPAPSVSSANKKIPSPNEDEIRSRDTTPLGPGHAGTRSVRC